MKKGQKQYRCCDGSRFSLFNSLPIQVLKDYQMQMINVFESVKLDGNGGIVRQSSENLLYAKILEMQKAIKRLENAVKFDDNND